MNPKRSLLAACVLAAALFAIPATASAGVFCVGAGANCSSSPVAPFSQDSAGINAAVLAADAHAGDDVLFIAAGNYSINTNTFPPLPASSDDLVILGAGAGQTIFNGTANGSSPLIDLQLSNADSALNGITLNATFTSNFATAVSVNRGQFNDFEIDQTGGVGGGAPASAIEMRAGTRAYHGTVSTDTNVIGLSLPQGQVYAEKISFQGAGAAAGIYAYGTANATLASLKLTGYRNGLRVSSGSVDISDSLVDLGSADGATGLYVEDQNTGVPASIVMHASRLTVIGTGQSVGLYVNVQEAGDSSTGYYKDLLLYNPNALFNPWYCGGSGSAKPTFDVSGLASNVLPNFGLMPGCIITQIAPAPLALSGSPFVDFAGRSLRPAWNSPIVDVGASNPPFANDLGDGSRVVDGDNDGTLTSDIGAFEYQADPPIGAIAAPSSAAPGQAIAFTHSMADPDPTNSVTGVQWNFGDGSSSTLSAPSHSYAAAGDYTVTVSATNQAGSVGTASATLRIATPVVPASPPTVKISSKPKKSFKIGKSGFAVARSGAPAFGVLFTDAAQARFTLQSIDKKRKLKALKGSQLFKLPGAASTVRFTFAGTWNKKKLATGGYRVTITPVSVTGATGTPVTVDIKLKK